MRNIMVFDIDGTIADCGHRLHHINSGEKPDWDAFYDECDKDTVIQPTADICRMVIADGLYKVVFMTGRAERVADKTRDWLRKYIWMGNWDFELYMRPEGNYDPDWKLKEEMAAPFLLNISAVWEDRQQVVDMWRRNGVICYQVQEGAY